MSGFINDKVRLGFSVILIVSGIATFVYGFMERSSGNDFNQIWMLAIVMLMGAMVHLQKIGKK